MSSECHIIFDWESLRDRVLRSSFPSLIPKVRADIVKYLARSEDTIYGISKATGYPIQSVLKALKVLIEKGYVECERKESKKRKVQANVCKLTELGKLAAIALRDDIELKIPIQQLPIFSDLINTISNLWLSNEKLRKVYREILMVAMAYSNLEIEYQKLPKDDIQQFISSVYYLSTINAAAQARNTVFMKVKEVLKDKVPSNLSNVIISKTLTVFEFSPISLFTENKLKELWKCDKEIRKILMETVRVFLETTALFVFNDYIIRLIFLGSLETQGNEEKWMKLIRLIDELNNINRKIYEELGLAGVLPKT